MDSRDGLAGKQRGLEPAPCRKDIASRGAPKGTQWAAVGLSRRSGSSRDLPAERACRATVVGSLFFDNRRRSPARRCLEATAAQTLRLRPRRIPVPARGQLTSGMGLGSVKRAASQARCRVCPAGIRFGQVYATSPRHTCALADDSSTGWEPATNGQWQVPQYGIAQRPRAEDSRQRQSCGTARLAISQWQERACTRISRRLYR